VSGPAFELRVDALALDGFDPGDREAIATAVEAALGRALAAEAADAALAPAVGSAVAEAIRAEAGR
jgi:hypothetical protein